MSMNKPNKPLSAILALMIILMLSLSVCACSFAEGNTVTLAELKAQAPERLQMTVTTDAGNTITVDAPVILPNADTIPTLLAKRATFNTANLEEHYPLEKGLPAYVRQASSAYDYDGSPSIGYCTGKASDLDGKTDYSMRAVLAPSETPPENDLTLEQVRQLVYDSIAEFDGDTTADLRVYRVNAMSGLYRIKMVTFEDKEAGVRYRMPEIDPSKPIKGASKGMWNVRLTQYFHGIPVFPSDYNITEDKFDGWPYPIIAQVRIMDESAMDVLLSYCAEESVLLPDTALASFDKVQESIRARLQSGQLKSVYQVSLGYAVTLVKGDSFLIKPENDYNMDARFVLIPVWQVCGYDLKDRSHRYFQGFTEPDELTVMQSLDSDFELWLDATTAQPVSSAEYDGEVDAQ